MASDAPSGSGSGSRPGPAAEGDDDYSDSTYGDEASITASVTSSIYAYEKEHGRSYHAYNSQKQYVLPNDEPELDRLDLQYHALKLVMDDRLFLAPVKNPGRILDCGTGTGIWVMDAGDRFPQAEVTGIDLSPVQPSWVPPNVKFFVDDFEHPWGFPEDHFDLVHGRVLIACIHDWPAYFAQCYRHTKPGGYIEAQELEAELKTDDDSFPPDSAMQEWTQLLLQGTANLGLNIRVRSTQIKTWMEAAGFEDVTIVDLRVPLGPWSEEKRLKEAGNAESMSIRDNLLGVTLRIWEKGLGRSYEELEVFLVKVRKEFDDKSIHAYFPFHVVYGKKPEREKVAENQEGQADS